MYALFPVILEWGTYCSHYYHLNSILSLVLTLYIFCGYTLIKTKWLSWIAGFALLFVVYSLVGSRLFIFVILVLLYEAEIGEKHWVYWALLLITGILLPEFLKELYSLSEEDAYQYPHAWLPAFFPAIVLACVLVATQFEKSPAYENQYCLSPLLPDFYWYCCWLLYPVMLRLRKRVPSPCLPGCRCRSFSCWVMPTFYLVAVFEPSELFQALGKFQR